MKLVDCRGLACPQPVVLVKKLFNEGCKEALQIVVDNFPAKENVLTLLAAHKVAVEGIKEEDSLFTITTVGLTGTEGNKTTDSNSGTGVTYIIDKDSIGTGDVELGKKLLIAFLNTLPDHDKDPATLFFMNSGINFALEGAPTLESLLTLEKEGVEVVVCGTCTNHFGVTDKVAVGRLGNMYDLIDLYNREKVVSI